MVNLRTLSPSPRRLLRAMVIATATAAGILSATHGGTSRIVVSAAAAAAFIVYPTTWRSHKNVRHHHPAVAGSFVRRASSSSSVEPADTARTSSAAAAACATPPPPPTTTTTMREGFLFSSFSDGLAKNAAARARLQRGLVRVLLRDGQQAAEAALSRSVRASPCNGPNMEALAQMEGMDRALDELEQHNNNNNPLEILQDALSSSSSSPLPLAAAPELRVLYIPTALYALRPESGSTPGKQRQRARADGKQRRDALVRLLHEELLPVVQIAAVTLDLDDGSVKQPVRSDSSSISQKDEPSALHPQQQQQRPFPTTGRQALQEWNPHVVYVQGGNTFWLYHCLHKSKDNNWRDALQTLVQREDTLYCGASAGAILAGAAMETAGWKGWDDPRVVPGRESNGDWKNVPGLNWCGGRAFFPHYEENEWGETVRVKQAELVQRRHRDQSSGGAVQVEDVVSLRDDQVWHLDGASGQATIL